MTEEEKKAIEYLENYVNDIKKVDTCETRAKCKAIATILNLINKQQKEIEKKNELEKEVADDIDKIAVELSKLSDNIYIVNQAMLLQKIAQEKLGKFYID